MQRNVMLSNDSPEYASMQQNAMQLSNAVQCNAMQSKAMITEIMLQWTEYLFEIQK